MRKVDNNVQASNDNIDSDENGTVAKGAVRMLNQPNSFITNPIIIKSARLSPTDRTTVSVRCGLSILNTLKKKEPWNKYKKNKT